MTIGDSPLTIIRLSRFAPKTRFCIFFKSTGPLLIHGVKQGQNLISEIRHQQSSYRTNHIIQHQVNRKPHVHERVPDYLQSEDIKAILHPPNSSDIAHHAKIRRSKRCTIIAKCCDGFHVLVESARVCTMFDKWLERMQLCVDHKVITLSTWCNKVLRSNNMWEKSVKGKSQKKQRMSEICLELDEDTSVWNFVWMTSSLIWWNMAEPCSFIFSTSLQKRNFLITIQ